MNTLDLKKYWESEEQIAKIKGWDFSYIADRYKSYESDLSWDYQLIVKSYLKPEYKLLDIDTGGGEVLLTFDQLYNLTTVTEGYAPNVKLCRDTLGTKGIRVVEMTDYSNMPFEDNEFNIVINRHGAYNVDELYRILKPGGMFITQQVGEDNDRELVELLLPNSKKMYKGMNLKVQKETFEKSGFEILMENEEYKTIEFYDVGALVWFARIIQWEFVDFSVEKCFDRLLVAQKMIETNGCVKGNVHRYLIVARKPN